MFSLLQNTLESYMKAGRESSVQYFINLVGGMVGGWSSDGALGDVSEDDIRHAIRSCDRSILLSLILCRERHYAADLMRRWRKGSISYSESQVLRRICRARISRIAYLLETNPGSLSSRNLRYIADSASAITVDS